MYTLKKSLGQHFLKDENICKKIVQALEIFPLKNLLEIGPGGGALTKYLLKIPGINFKCVEVDDEKVKWLLATYPQLQGRVIHDDFLQINQPFDNRFTVVGNFPYNISTQILFKLLDWKTDIEGAVGMFQKEVAQRIVAKEGSKIYGITSVLVQAFFKVEYLFEVSESCFQPPPKVRSAILRLTPLMESIPMKSARAFFMLVKTAFNQRRKTLRNAVKNLFEPDILVQEIFDRRAEQLTVRDFAQLTFLMKPY